MNFTKQERLELEALSLRLFGNDTGWQKMAKMRFAGGFKVIQEPAKVRLKNGSVMNMSTAIQKGLVPAVDKEGKPIPVITESKKVVYRNPTFAEIKQGMESAIETHEISGMPPVHLILHTAMKFLDNTLINMPYLVVADNQKKDFEDLLALLPEDKQNIIKKVTVPNGNPQVFCVDGLQFVSDVVFAANQPEDAKDLLESYQMIREGRLEPDESHEMLEGQDMDVPPAANEATGAV